MWWRSVLEWPSRRSKTSAQTRTLWEVLSWDNSSRSSSLSWRWDGNASSTLTRHGSACLISDGSNGSILTFPIAFRRQASLQESRWFLLLTTLVEATLLWPRSTLTQTSWSCFSETLSGYLMKRTEAGGRRQSSTSTEQNITGRKQHLQFVRSYKFHMLSQDHTTTMLRRVSTGIVFSKEWTSIRERSRQARGKLIKMSLKWENDLCLTS